MVLLTKAEPVGVKFPSLLSLEQSKKYHLFLSHYQVFIYFLNFKVQKEKWGKKNVSKISQNIKKRMQKVKKKERFSLLFFIIKRNLFQKRKKEEINVGDSK